MLGHLSHLAEAGLSIKRDADDIIPKGQVEPRHRGGKLTVPL